MYFQGLPEKFPGPGGGKPGVLRGGKLGLPGAPGPLRG